MTLADNSENLKVETNSPVQNSTINPPQNRSGFRQFFWKTFKGRPNQQPTLLGHFLITSGLLTLIGLGYFSLEWYADKTANNWLSPQKELTPVDNGLKPGASDRARLAEQLNEIQSRINRYSAMMVFFYKHYYMSISLTSASALVAGICLFFISKVGWEKANNALINVFIVTSSAVIYFGDLPGIFKHDESSAASRDLYLEHISLRNEVRSYLATGGTIGGDPEKPDAFSPTETSRFIHYVDKKMAELNKIPIAFDATRITGIERNLERLTVPEKVTSSPKAVQTKKLMASPKPSPTQ
ncbi:hypothetical protein H6F74_14755 [Trichocoleus sp. FACHB-90]|uniref:hypothetical protein n=1 Tax=Cyanophyceae TaxID=3028117 RepID=UPI001682A63A|nr:hypothetical protein [Trichocoleus sp. FACHB-90]MBD1927493.1 hypothetical protein [Trichocoleus sp. FACHB-90]